MNTYDIAGISIGGVYLGGITSQSFTPGVSELRQGTSGTIWPSWVNMMSGAPMFSFTTVDIGTALGITGFACTAFSATPVEVIYRAKTIGGVWTSGSTHMKVSISAGLIAPRTLSASHGGEATMSFDVYSYSSTDTSPITISSVANPHSPELTTPRKFTLGKFKFGTNIVPVTSVSISPGADVEVLSHSGRVYPSYIGVREYRPIISITSTDPSPITTIGNSGAVCTPGVTAYFQKMAQCGARVAAATAEHVKVTTTTGLMILRSTSGSHRGTGLFNYEYVPTWDGTNDMMQLSTASAIT